jgi:uncharacterized membrane protein
LAVLTIYGVRMFFSVVKSTPRFVISMIFAVILILLAFALAAMSFLGVSLAFQGWAANPPTTIQVPVGR